MAEFPSKVSTRTSSPAQGVGASVSAMRPDLGFVRSALGVLALLQLVVTGLLCCCHRPLYHRLCRLCGGGRSDIPEGLPTVQPALGCLFLCLSGDDCLRTECFLQLPGLARSGQQRGHESDGWGLLLSQLCCDLSHGWVLAQGHPQPYQA
ncbi:plasma membrane proteolipid [Rattus norvegicus]|uniref:Plasma membrane proteolipid n=1 Tax=Rattus norvegicus TaxID=10116 RepID=A6JY51_RAT|nr:plasma membrane proteolipid [Rattus norvegicus]